LKRREEGIKGPVTKVTPQREGNSTESIRGGKNGAAVWAGSTGLSLVDCRKEGGKGESL